MAFEPKGHSLGSHWGKASWSLLCFLGLEAAWSLLKLSAAGLALSRSPGELQKAFLGFPRKAQERPGAPQESPGEPRSTQERPGAPRSAQERPGEPRRAQERSGSGEPIGAQERSGAPMSAQKGFNTDPNGGKSIMENTRGMVSWNRCVEK